MTSGRPLSGRIPGGHNQKDGGYSLLEPSPNERDRVAARVLAAQPEAERWLAAANHLSQVYSLSAKVPGGSGPQNINVPLGHEIQQAEIEYDEARSEARRAMFLDDLYPA